MLIIGYYFIVKTNAAFAILIWCDKKIHKFVAIKIVKKNNNWQPNLIQLIKI